MDFQNPSLHTEVANIDNPAEENIGRFTDQIRPVYRSGNRTSMESSDDGVRISNGQRGRISEDQHGPVKKQVDWESELTKISNKNTPSKFTRRTTITDKIQLI